MKFSVLISFTIYIILSLAYLTDSQAPLRVHLVSLGCFFIAFFLASAIAESGINKKPKWYIWLLVGFLGLLLHDYLSSIVVSKHEFLMGWYLSYPFGLFGLYCLQSLVSWIDKALPYNKRFNGTQTERDQ